MIRRAIRGVARRVLARSQPKPSSPPAPPPRAPIEPVDADDDGPGEGRDNVEVEAEDLARWIREDGRTVVFLDIREPHEVMQTHLQDAVLLPMNRVPEQLDRLPRDRTLVVYCAAGVRSYGVAHFLRQQGFSDAWSLVGGIGAWVQEGGAYEQPDWETKLRPLMTVRLGDAACEAAGLPAGSRGTVQAVRRQDGRVRLVLDVPVDGGWRRLQDVDEAELA